jgi:hypothetical protein
LADGYRKIYCLIDMDTVISENKEQAYLTEKTRLEKKGVKVLELNPCFELWFLLHFQQTSQSFNNCDAVGDKLKKIAEFENYDKSKDYHNRQNFYKKLKPQLVEHAHPNAKFLEKNRDLQSKNYPRSEVYKLLVDLGILENEEDKKKK